MEAFATLLGKLVDEAINPALYFLFALAIAVFIWGIIKFIVAADNEEERAQGKKHLGWGLIGLFIMFAVWGIIAIIRNFIGSL